ncbi:DUF5681 domain-containing protein [Spirosoma foliorum]|uniref:DUF5681 domain-containing protein n=1 Tax=Spirosoma foliorum TaxID=2710596 RepID=A0A7G5GUD6_9BACT|nr:DUF5681 domain-containing protein [Spirosoma foliorum]QMW02478.1 hypothetical protein H3H32_31980 [Spirosoma foliorum]
MDRKGRNGGILHSYEKGQSGNPKGRPPKNRNLISQILQELGNDWEDLEITIIGRSEGNRPFFYQSLYSTQGEQTFNAVIAAQLMVRCMAGDIDAIKIVLDRTEGRVRPPMKLDSGESSKPIIVIEHSPSTDLPLSQ